MLSFTVSIYTGALVLTECLNLVVSRNLLI